jgi:hypothetical protein
MKTTSVRWIIVAILICSGCAVIDVDKTADLANYDSFGWGKSTLAIANPAYRSDLIEGHIKASITAEFALKGVSYTSKRPDLLVSYEAFIEREERGGGVGGTRFYYYPYFNPYYPGIFYPYGGFMMGAWSEPYTDDIYNRGTLVLNVRERKTGKLIWRGLVQGNVDNLKSLNKTIAKGVKAILKKYPAVPPKLPPLPKEKPII